MSTAQADGRLLAERLSLSDWPDAQRRAPRRGDAGYLVLAPLARDLLAAVESELGGRHDLRVLDVGCDNKPYLPLLADRAVSWRGLDVYPGPHVDDVGQAEELPYSDGSFDLVLCSQVIEHLAEPERAVAEVRRVLAPGGLALVSTHGVHVFHPNPVGSDQDYWRWTHAGLQLLFERHGDWSRVGIRPAGHAFACVAFVAATYANVALGRFTTGRARRAVLWAINSLGLAADRLVPQTLRTPRGGSLSANYLVVARAP